MKELTMEKFVEHIDEDYINLINEFRYVYGLKLNLVDGSEESSEDYDTILNEIDNLLERMYIRLLFWDPEIEWRKNK